MLTVDHLDRITGNGGNGGRKAALADRLAQFGGPICAAPVLAQCLAQMLHESGALRYVREIWGPTKAQRGYEGRLDLGNIRPGDGKRYLGRDVLQITGRTNYRALTAWVHEEFGDGPDFEAVPDLLEEGQWLGIGAIWYLRTRPGLLTYAASGNIEMVTRRINGGLNGYADRLDWYRRAALVLLGYGRDEVARFQRDHGLTADGICGPATRAALHHELNDI